MPVRRRQPRYKKKQVIRRRRMMKGRRRGGNRSRYHGIKYIKETINKGVVTMAVASGGVNPPTLEKLSCNLADISQTASWATVSPFSALCALYGRYCITGVKWTFIPLSTSSVAGQKNVDRVCYAPNKDPQDTLTGEQDIIRQDDCKFTNTARKFSVYIKHPTPILSQTAQQMTDKGLGPQQYATPLGGATAPNQVAVSYNASKWTWLPTRVVLQSDGMTGTDLGAVLSAQYPDHVGLDLVISSQQNALVTTAYDVYTVYQTLYVAFKEQD